MQSIGKQVPLSLCDQVQLARHKDRPRTMDYIERMCRNFFALRGDRRYGDDAAIVGGVATLVDRTIAIIGHQRGQSPEVDAGMPHPEGYRKVQRLMRHAEKFNFPVICLIDTPGAFPGPEAEERGQMRAVAESLAVMASLRVPTVAVVIGEGGSNDALALGLADRALMLEHSIYAVTASSEETLWPDSTPAACATENMLITAPDLLKLGIVDEIIPEPGGGAHLDRAACIQGLAGRLHRLLTDLVLIPICDLLEQRYAKFRNLGQFSLVRV